MNRKLFSITKIGLAAMLVCSFFTGCKHATHATEAPSSETETSLPEVVFTREDTVFASITSHFLEEQNLLRYEIPNDEGKNYSSISTLNDQILLYGSSDDYQDDQEAMERDIFFSILNPFTGDITNSLSLTTSFSTIFKTSKDKLLLYNEEKKLIEIYDKNLSLLASHSTTSFPDNNLSSIAVSSKANIYYATTDKNTLVKVNFDSADVSYNVIPLNYYNLTIHEITQSDDVLLLSGLNKETMIQETFIYLPDTNQILGQTQSSNYLSGCIGEDLSFLTTIGDNSSVWSFCTDDSCNTFFENSYIQPIVAEEDKFLYVKDSYENDGYDHFFEGYFGDTLSSSSYFKFNCKQQDTEAYFDVATSFIYFDNYDYAILLAHENYDHPFLIIWDTQISGDATILAHGKEYFDTLYSHYEKDDTPDDNRINLILDPDSYDWGECSDVYAFSKELEEKYNVQIHIGVDVPLSIGGFDIGQLTYKDRILDALNNLDKILGYYPSDIFEQFKYGTERGLHFYIADTLTSDGSTSISEAAGFVTHEDSITKLVFAAEYSSGDTIHHELSHVIDSRLSYISENVEDFVFTEEKWNNHNPEGFVYQSDYTSYEGNSQYSDNPDYFIYEYGATYPTEDRATIFAEAMNDYCNGIQLSDTYFFGDNEKLLAKLQYYCDCIRAGYDTSNWPTKLPWEP